MTVKNKELSRRRFLQVMGCTAACGAVSTFSPGPPGELSGLSAPPAKELGVKPAKYYDKIGDKKITCKLCPHECRVADLERGTCGVRENRGGSYYTLVHSNPCSAAVDPIEKKPIYHFYPTTRSFSIATAGCNFVCKFCQNWEISQKRPEQVKSIFLPPDRVIGYARNKGCKTVAHTYTEPVIFFEYMNDCAVEGKKRGVPNLMISNGFIQEKPMRELCKSLGAVKIDLKAFTDNFYKDQCAGTLKPVLDTLRVLKDENMWFEIVVLLIPTLNDGEKEIRQMSRWIYKNLGPDVPLHFSRYHPTFMLKNIPPTPPKTVLNARRVAMDNGIKFVYAGNMVSGASHTYCPKCKKILIERVRYYTSISGLKGNRCKHCGEIIPGVFK